MMLFTIILSVLFPPLFCMEYDICAGKILNFNSDDLVQNIYPISFQLCIKECEGRTSCASVNYDANFLQCNLLRKSHLNNSLNLQNAERHAYVFLKQKNQPCQNCSSYQKCVSLSSGDGACVGTNECRNPPSVPFAVYTEQTSPPTAIYTCVSGYTAVGNVATSTCNSGELWSPINLQCVPPIHGGWSSWTVFGECSVTYGRGVRVRSRACNNPEPQYNGMDCPGANTSETNCRKCFQPKYMMDEADSVHWSSASVEADGSVLNLYWLNSPKSWTPVDNLSSEYIEMNFQEKRYVMGIGIKGRGDIEQFVLSFVAYTVDFEDGTLHLRSAGIRSANSDQSTLVQVNYEPYLYTSGIRIYPYSWYIRPSLRFDVLGCRAALEER